MFFKAYSLQHILAFVILGLILFSVYKLRHAAVLTKHDKTIRFTLAILMTVLEISFLIWSWRIKGFNHDHLPFELCSITMWLTVVALLINNNKIIKVTLPWAIIGVLLAYLSPSIDGTPFGFPHFRFFHFFGLHALFLVSNLYFLYTDKIKSYNYKDLWVSFKILMIYAFFITIFNHILKYNYLFTISLPGPAKIFHKFIKAPFYLIPYALIIFGLYNLIYLLIRKGKKYND